MEKFGKSQPVKRIEDVRFLIGEGRYVDDIVPEGALYAYFVRSTVAHGVVTGIDVDEAKAAPGVHAVLTQADLEAAGVLTSAFFGLRRVSHGWSPFRAVYVSFLRANARPGFQNQQSPAKAGLTRMYSGGV